MATERSGEGGGRGGGGRGWLRADAIVDAALLIVDREGFEALSMRRIAQELGVGTMSLYHHIADRDELMYRMADSVTGEMLVPEAVLDDWREGLAAIARATRAMFARHPWVLESRHHDTPPTPNVLRHIEQSARVAEALPVDPETARAILMAADDLAIGAAVRETRQQGWGDITLPAPARELLDSGEIPRVQAFFGRGPISGPPPSRFEDGLSLLLDGIQARVLSQPEPSAGASPPLRSAAGSEHPAASEQDS